MTRKSTQRTSGSPGIDVLEEMGVWVSGTYELTPKGYLDVEGSVSVLSKCSVLPIKFGVVTEYFFACEGRLKTLTNSPVEVGLIYFVSENLLEDLKGAPRKVGGNFNCYGNKIKSLAGAPMSVGGNFYCHLNPLTSIAGLNCEITGDFYGPECLPDIAHGERFQDFDREGAATLRVPGSYVRDLYDAEHVRSSISEVVRPHQAPSNRQFKI